MYTRAVPRPNGVGQVQALRRGEIRQIGELGRGALLALPARSLRGARRSGRLRDVQGRAIWHRRYRRVRVGFLADCGLLGQL